MIYSLFIHYKYYIIHKERLKERHGHIAPVLAYNPHSVDPPALVLTCLVHRACACCIRRCVSIHPYPVHAGGRVLGHPMPMPACGHTHSARRLVLVPLACCCALNLVYFQSTRLRTQHRTQPPGSWSAILSGVPRHRLCLVMANQLLRGLRSMIDRWRRGWNRESVRHG